MSDTLPKIYTVLPDEIRNMHGHGQWVFDTPGLVLNFACELDEFDMPIVEPWMQKLVAFLASDAPVMEFESPHTPGINYLHRHAAERIILTQPAWSQKVYARTRKGGPALIDDGTGMPILRKLN